MAESPRDPDGPSPLRLDERILATLAELPGEIAFSGLRRVLGAHPESLARALRRLEREGLVLRSGAGYRALLPGTTLPPAHAQGLRPLAEMELTNASRAPELLARLAGRWFGSLRWVGVVERSDEHLLAWAPRDGAGLVLLGVRGGHLRLLVAARPAGKPPRDTEDAAFELLLHAVKALRTPADPAASEPPSPRRTLHLDPGPVVPPPEN